MNIVKSIREFDSKVKVYPVVFFAVAILYMEMILRGFTQDRFFGSTFVIILFFDIAAAFLLGALTNLCGKKSKIVVGIIFTLIAVLYATQIIYYRFFNKYLILNTVAKGGFAQVVTGDMFYDAIREIKGNFHVILLMMVPLVVYFGFFDKLVKRPEKRLIKKLNNGVIGLVASVFIHAVVVFAISFVPTLSIARNGLFDTSFSMGKFGLLYTEVLDVKYNLLGIDQKIDFQDESVKIYKELEAEANVAGIDLEALAEAEDDKALKILSKYLAQKTPTYKNEYTGMYKGYNLVMVVAEGFSPYAIHKDLTPTLYKMQEEGFDFTNFYTPIWGVSTSDGEYTAATGLIPKSGVWSFSESSDNYMPYCLGNMFRSIGYDDTYAYHNNSYVYYRRHESHPNMGYTYKGYGNGVEDYVTNVWPQSDHELVKGSIDDYIDSDEPFCAYYMTVSGHLDYDTQTNAMVAKNWEYVKDLDCSDILKGYYACNMELDRAMEELLRRLNEKGIADKTVIAITPDHYPYGLEQDTGDMYAIWREVLGHAVDTQYELYESNFLLYCQGTENAPTIDKVCYSADILPTLLNLFGFEYDSRLLIGRDILSSSEGMVIFSDRSFICEYGRYDSVEDEFVFDQDVTMSEDEKEEYVESAIAYVNNTFKVSSGILEHDYFGYVFEE